MRNAEIEAAILAAPDDPNAYLVYADWLQSRGDPRGELISLQHAMRAHNDIEEFARFRKHEELLRNQHAIAWLGEPLATSLHRTYFEWRMGFVDAARLDAPHDTELVTRVDGGGANPYAITRPTEPTLVGLVTGLLESPCGWLVRTITLCGSIRDTLEAMRPLPSRNLRRVNLVQPRATRFDRTVQEEAKRELAPEIMRMLNANIDVELGSGPSSEKFAWVRPKPSKRRT